jgi:hypothetical protein
MEHSAIGEKEHVLLQLDPLIKSKKVEIDISNKKHLLELFRFMDVHITAYSTSVIEAEAMGVPSITLHEKACSFFKKQIEEETVLMVTDQTSLINAINHQLMCSSEEVMRRSDIFKTDYNKVCNEFFTSKASTSTLKLNNLIFEARLLAANMEIEKLLNLYYHNINEKDLLYYLGSTSKELGKENESSIYYEKFLINFSNVEFNTEIPIIELDSLFSTYESSLNRDAYYNLVTYIKNQVINDYFIYGTFMKYLFEREQYTRLIQCFKREGNIDYLYFSGRCLLKLEKEKESTDQLEKYIQKVKNESIDYPALTFSNNYVASAYFYLGELFYNKKEYVKAQLYLSNCLHLYKGYHKKAKQYLKLME